MKLGESETIRKQAEAALSEERFRLVASASKLKRDSLIPQDRSKTTSYSSQWVG